MKLKLFATNSLGELFDRRKSNDNIDLPLVGAEKQVIITIKGKSILTSFAYWTTAGKDAVDEQEFAQTWRDHSRILARRAAYFMRDKH